MSNLTIWGVFISCGKKSSKLWFNLQFFRLFFNKKFRQGCQNWLLRVHNIIFRKKQSEEPKCGRKQFSCLLSKHYRRFCRKWIPGVRNSNLKNLVFLENNICFHHFRLLSESFSASLLNFFRWDSQNCIFYFKKKQSKEKTFLSKTCMFSSFSNSEANSSAFCRNIFSVARECRFHVSRQWFWGIYSGEPKRRRIPRRAVRKYFSPAKNELRGFSGVSKSFWFR